MVGVAPSVLGIGLAGFFYRCKALDPRGDERPTTGNNLFRDRIFQRDSQRSWVQSVERSDLAKNVGRLGQGDSRVRGNRMGFIVAARNRWVQMVVVG